MRKIIAITIVILIGSNYLDAQKQDYIWLQGYGHGFNPVSGLTFGTTVFDFNYSPLQVSYDWYQMNFEATNSSICDSDGNLLFYSNGINARNALKQKIQNSDSLSPTYMTYVWDPNIATNGDRKAYSIYILPSISNPSQYYLVHALSDIINHNEQTPDSLMGTNVLVSLVDMSANSGHGKVLTKNTAVVTDMLSISIAFTKHANGRDWWGLVQKLNSSCFYRILCDSFGVHALPDLTCSGTPLHELNFGASSFSTDGGKFITSDYYTGLKIYDFDRCEGNLSNPLFLPLTNGVDSNWYAYGLAVSPNSRFLYVSFTYYLYQLDLWAPDILGSIDTIARFDNTYLPTSTFYHTSQLAPDGKIYISGGSGDTTYHVIERPDEKGDSCLVKPHSLNLPSVSLGVPNFPNYRLGALPGGCGNVSIADEAALGEKEKILKVYPNPATNFVVVDYGFTDWSKGEISLEISNELGQIVAQQHLPMYSGFQKIDVSSFASGVYHVFIKRGVQIISTAKFARA